MTANAAAVNYAVLQREVARQLGWDRTPANWSSIQTLDFTDILASGLRQFYYPVGIAGEKKSHAWSFLYPLAEFELSAAYTDGTITIASGVVTGSGTVFPTWADQGDLWVDQGRYTVASRDSDTQLTLDDTTVAAAAGSGYTLRRHYYDLPDDFGGMVSDGFTYRRDEQFHLPDITIVSERDIRQIDRAFNNDIYPSIAALIPIPPTATQSSRWKVTFYPLAETQYFVEYRYEAIPPVIDATNDYPYGATEHGETIIASCLDMAEQKIKGSYDLHQGFLERLTQSVMHDRRSYSVHTLGFGVKSRGLQNEMGSLRSYREDTPYGNLQTSFNPN